MGVEMTNGRILVMQYHTFGDISAALEYQNVAIVISAAGL